MSGSEIEGRPPRRPGQVMFVVVAVAVLLGAGLLLWLHLSGRAGPPDRDEVLREEVRKQVNQRVQESLKLHGRELP